MKYILPRPSALAEGRQVARPLRRPADRPEAACLPVAPRPVGRPSLRPFLRPRLKFVPPRTPKLDLPGRPE